VFAALLVLRLPVTLSLGLLVTALTSVGSGAAKRPPLHIDRMAAGRELSDGFPEVSVPLSLCPPRNLPDGSACVRIPDDDDSGPDNEAEFAAHHDKKGNWVVYEQIPRRPERPADYAAYQYPVPCAGECVVSGYDLDQPDEHQRRGRRLRHVGHGAVDLPERKGTPIVLLALEHQEGDAEVVYAGPLFGITVITRHSLREAGRLRDYVVLFGHLETFAAGVHTGARLKEGDTIGSVGDTGSPELVHLHLEVRRVRDGVDVAKLSPDALVANENTVVCDPRNVLPLR
jgi:murein DD-endopeptidase MepM/ murein hydrolase activator NlpD